MSYESFGGDSCGWEERSFRSKRRPRPSVLAQPCSHLRFWKVVFFDHTEYYGIAACESSGLTSQNLPERARCVLVKNASLTAPFFCSPHQNIFTRHQPARDVSYRSERMIFKDMFNFPPSRCNAARCSLFCINLFRLRARGELLPVRFVKRTTSSSQRRGTE